VIREMGRVTSDKGRVTSDELANHRLVNLPKAGDKGRGKRGEVEGTRHELANHRLVNLP
jgi:hypothetical protein